MKKQKIQNPRASDHGINWILFGNIALSQQHFLGLAGLFLKPRHSVSLLSTRKNRLEWKTTSPHSQEGWGYWVERGTGPRGRAQWGWGCWSPGRKEPSGRLSWHETSKGLGVMVRTTGGDREEQERVASRVPRQCCRVWLVLGSALWVF